MPVAITQCRTPNVDQKGSPVRINGVVLTALISLAVVMGYNHYASKGGMNALRRGV